MANHIASTSRVGMEIETPFRHFFPDLHERFFGSGRRYTEMPDAERNELTAALASREPAVLAKLTEASERLGLMRGRDRYWEFVFPPVAPVAHGPVVVELLDAGLLPRDLALSVHFTVGGISRAKAFAVLLMLETEFATADRILSGFHGDERATWNRKGRAGVVEKRAIDLDHDPVAFELRTLKIAAPQLPAVLLRLHALLADEGVVAKAKALAAKIGLPWEPWTAADFEKFAASGVLPVA